MIFTDAAPRSNPTIRHSYWTYPRLFNRRSVASSIFEVVAARFGPSEAEGPEARNSVSSPSSLWRCLSSRPAFSASDSLPPRTTRRGIGRQPFPGSTCRVPIETARRFGSDGSRRLAEEHPIRQSSQAATRAGQVYSLQTSRRGNPKQPQNGGHDVNMAGVIFDSPASGDDSREP